MSDPCPECDGELRGRHRHLCYTGSMVGVCPSCFGDGCAVCRRTVRAPDGGRDAADEFLQMIAVAGQDRAPTLEKT